MFDRFLRKLPKEHYISYLDESALPFFQGEQRARASVEEEEGLVSEEQSDEFQVFPARRVRHHREEEQKQAKADMQRRRGKFPVYPPDSIFPCFVKISALPLIFTADTCSVN